eukprot:COSAG06_NODE_12770_length_1332_cov_1.150041_1_plen_443_part_11
MKRIIELKLFEAQTTEGISLGCGHVVLLAAMTRAGALAAVEDSTSLQRTVAAAADGVVTLMKRVCPMPLPPEHWISTCDVVDVTTLQLAVLLVYFAYNADRCVEEPCFDKVLVEAVHIAKVNALAGLSNRPTMSYFSIRSSFQLIEAGARVERHTAVLLDSGVVEAMDGDFSFQWGETGQSMSSFAAGALVAVCGKNEGGKTLSRSAVAAVLAELGTYLDKSNFRLTYPARKVLPSLQRIATMAISDANKKHLIQHSKLLDLLLECLIINEDNHRKGQDGADALQEASAGVLHELSLFGPGAAALRSHSGVIPTLHKLCEVGTKVSKERGAAALFELEEDKRPKMVAAAAAADDGSGTGLCLSQKPPPHVMASYNWDHQDVILRVVASLQDRGYLVWVDTEQMKGATVDTMALAVEGSAVVLIGVSRAYKESSNCRMEAQYAL